VYEYPSKHMKIKHVRVKRVVGRKEVKGRTYVYEYYVLSLNLYIPRSIVEKWGEEFVVIKDVNRGVITIVPKKLAEKSLGS